CHHASDRGDRAAARARVGPPPLSGRAGATRLDRGAGGSRAGGGVTEPVAARDAPRPPAAPAAADVSTAGPTAGQPLGRAIARRFSTARRGDRRRPRPRRLAV